MLFASWNISMINHGHVRTIIFSMSNAHMISGTQMMFWLLLTASIPIIILSLWWKRRTGPKLEDDWPRQVNCRVEEFKNRWPDYPKDKTLVLDRTEYRVLCAVCDTFIPSFREDDVRQSAKDYLLKLLGNDELLHTTTKDLKYFAVGALELEVPQEVCKIMEKHFLPDAIKMVRLVLKALDMSISLLLLTGSWYGGGFSTLDFRQREDILRSLLKCWLIPLRGAVTGKVYFTCQRASPEHTNGNEKRASNPNWKTLNYEDRTVEMVKQVNQGKPVRPPQLQLHSKSELLSSTLSGGMDVREMQCDVVIVGSGAGGGAAAGVLTQAGLNVVVLEKGAYHSEEDFARWTEAEGDEGLYERGGWLASEQLSISVLAGSCVGGGTTLNWCASFRTPQHIRRDWAVEKKLGSFAEPAFDEALDAVCRRVNVNVEHSHRNQEIKSTEGLVVNQNNEALWEGAKTIGATCRAVPRDVKGCKDCTACERGCPYGAKQSTMITFLEDAQETGNLRLLAHAHVDKVLHQEGRAVGVLATVKEEGTGAGPSYQLLVWANTVISAAGSLHTPALFLRSGLKHDKIGRHLAIHPVSGVGALFPGQEFEHHRGVGMGTYVDDFMLGAEGDGYGGVFETPPCHPGLSAAIVPWSSAFHYRMFCILKWHMSVMIYISRDESSPDNRITIDQNGQPRIHYLLTPRDRKNLMFAVEKMMRMSKGLGCKLALPINEGFKTYREHRDGEKGFQAYLKYLDEMKMPVCNTQLFTAHQMCSCRMAATPEEGPVRETGETWEVKNLYVMDASVFPTSLGINPMITIEATSFMLAKKLATLLKGEEAVKAIEKKYCRPSRSEIEGVCAFPNDGRTLKGYYGVTGDEW